MSDTMEMGMGWREAVATYDVYFLDFNNTTHQTKSGGPFPKGIDPDDPEKTDLEWIPGRKEVLLALRKKGKRLIYISIQGGAAWGLFDPNDMQAVIQREADQVGFAVVLVCYRDTSEKAKAKARVKYLTEDEYFAGHSRRKPGGGMLLEGMWLLRVPRERCVMIGDNNKGDDEGAALDAGIDFIHADFFFSDPPTSAEGSESAQ